jgi:hypothetical protein
MQEQTTVLSSASSVPEPNLSYYPPLSSAGCYTIIMIRPGAIRVWYFSDLRRGKEDYCRISTKKVICCDEWIIARGKIYERASLKWQQIGQRNFFQFIFINRP